MKKSPLRYTWNSQVEKIKNLFNIRQLYGNNSYCLNKGSLHNKNVKSNKKYVKPDKITAALYLPTGANYNLFPKADSLKTDLLERNIDVGFLQEVWEQSTNSDHQFAIEKMLELSGLQYFSTTRPPNKRGVSYGGAAIVVNLEKFSCEKLKVNNPSNLEAVWGLLQSKNPTAKYKKIIVCSFYSPPNKKRNNKMADHIVSIYPTDALLKVS